MHKIVHLTISGQPALIFGPGHLFVTFELTISSYSIIIFIIIIIIISSSSLSSGLKSFRLL